jgi:hypothetical protein
MNLLLLLISLSALTQSSVLYDESSDQTKTQAAIIAWADQLFIKHSDYKFDELSVFETDEYTMQSLRIKLYEEKIQELKAAKENETYTGTSESLERDLNKLDTKLTQSKELIDSIQRINYYETHFWTNIQTTDGITVYYELIIKQNHLFEILEARENSSIGKKGTGSKIAYKPLPLVPKVIEE